MVDKVLFRRGEGGRRPAALAIKNVEGVCSGKKEKA